MFYLLLLLFLSSKNKIEGTKKISTSQNNGIIVTFIMFGVFGVCYGDYFEYEGLVKQAYKIYHSYSGDRWYIYIHMEPIYNYLAVICQGNYYLWRLIWFFCQFVFLGFVFKKVGINTYNSYLVFSFFALQSVCAGRVSWGITLFWLGLYAFLYTGKKFYLLFVALSVFAHNSMLILFALIPLAFLKIKKGTIIVFILLVPLMFTVLRNTLENITLYINVLGDTGYSDFLNVRLRHGVISEEEESFFGKSLGENIQIFMLYIPLYYIFLRMTYDYFSRKIILPRNLQFFFNMNIYMFMFTCVVLASGLEIRSLYQRSLMMLYLPVFMLTYAANRKFYMRKKDYRICLYVLCLSYIAAFIKAAYYYYSHGVIIRVDI